MLCLNHTYVLVDLIYSLVMLFTYYCRLELIMHIRLSALVITFLLVFPATNFAFDLGKTLSDTVGKTVKDVVQKGTGSIGDAITSVLPDVSPNAEKDDGEAYDLSTGVIIFGYDGCPYCRKAYGYMRKNNIEYTLMDTEKNSKANRIFSEEGHRGVPVMYVEGEVLKGFSDKSYKNLLSKHGKL